MIIVNESGLYSAIFGSKLPSAKKFKRWVRKEMLQAHRQNGDVVKTQTSLISEGDLYRLIIGSKLPSAQKFEEWVMDEVLPSIRKNNVYSVSFSDKDILLKAVDIVDVKIKEKKDELNKLEQSRSIFNILID